MKIKMILPALTEAKRPYRRPIKYSLFPPLGLPTLAAYCCVETWLVCAGTIILHFLLTGLSQKKQTT